MINRFNQFVNHPDFGRLFLRVSLGALMLLHGIHKAQAGGLNGIEGMLNGYGLPSFIAYGVLVGEIICPILIILGIFTRASALILAITMAVAIAMIHQTHIFFLDAKTGAWGIESAGLYLLVALSVMFIGSGRYALRRD